MAKKQKQPETVAKPQTKKPGVGAVFGSIGLFILTFLSAILLLCSSAAYITLSQGSLQNAIREMDLVSMEVTDRGVQKSLSSHIYDWYMDGAPNLTEEYAQEILAEDQVQDLLCQYIDQLSDYLTYQSDQVPTLEGEDFADALTDQSLARHLGIRLTQEDEDYLQWATADDFAWWNDVVDDAIGEGPGKVMLRFFCSLPGLMTTAALLLVFLVLWVLFAVKGRWRKGRMLVGIGVAVALPNLLVLLTCGIALLLITVMEAFLALSFVSQALPYLLAPLIWPALAYLLAGVLVASVGFSINGAAKAKKKKALADPAETAPVEMPETKAAPVLDAPQNTAPPVAEPEMIRTMPQGNAAPEQSFVYKEIAPQPEQEQSQTQQDQGQAQQEQSQAQPVQTPQVPDLTQDTAQTPAEESTEASTSATAIGRCPQCGTEIQPGEKFCGSCGSTIA